MKKYIKNFVKKYLLKVSVKYCAGPTRCAGCPFNGENGDCAVYTSVQALNIC